MHRSTFCQGSMTSCRRSDAAGLVICILSTGGCAPARGRALCLSNTVRGAAGRAPSSLCGPLGRCAAMSAGRERPRTNAKEVPMRSNRSCGVGSLTFAATLVVACMLAAPAGARAGALLDALSPQARHNIDRVVQYAVAYDHCRGDYELDDREADSFVVMLSEAIQELPHTPRSTSTAARYCCSTCSWKCSGRPRQRLRPIARWPVSAASACRSSIPARAS